MAKWNLIIDVAECTNCNNCTLAAMDEYVGNDWPGYAAPMPKHGHRWINILQKERGQAPMIDIAYVPTLCNHCDDAPCIKAARDGAITKRPDGIVLIDPVKAKGQKQLVDACPYGHIWWNEELQLPQSWPFDAHLLDQGWQQTRGQQSCPTGAMRAVKLDDAEMERKAREDQLEVMRPELGTKPRVWYRNLWRYTTCFIGGTICDRARRRGRLRRGRAGPAHEGRRCNCRDGERQFRRLQVRPPARGLRAPIRSRSPLPAGRPRPSRPSLAKASIWARSGCSHPPIASRFHSAQARSSALLLVSSARRASSGSR